MKASDIIQQMHEAGAPIEAILIAVRALEARDDVDEARKAAQRERKRRQRANALSESVTVTGRSRDADGTEQQSAPLSAPPNDIYSNPPHHTPQHTTGGRDDFPCPDWCEPAVWRDLKRNRKTKKLTNTPTAHARFVRDVLAMADDEWPPGRLVEAIAARGWGGAYDPRETKKSGGSNGKQFGNSNQRTAALAEAKLQSLGGA